MFRFENNEFLYLLLAVPALFLLFWYNRKRWGQNIKKFGDQHLVRSLLVNYSSSRPWWKFSIFMLALTMLILALANPQFGSKLREVKKEGVEIMVALDVSKSMKAEDIKPNRLSRAKRSIEGFVNNLQGDLLGLVVFAGEAYIQIPMTGDYAAAKMYLDNINTDIVATQGTSIGKAIEMSMRAFSEDPESAKVILLITDGENHGEKAINAAKLAADEGVKIYCVGMGTTKGAPIPAQGGGFHRDNAGNVVMTKLNEETLAELADAGNGRYILAGKSGSGLDMILKEISGLSKAEREVEVYSEFDDQYQYPLALALLLIILEVLISRRKEHTVQKLKSLKS
ncbi:MAG: vWA domain-containing protein [Bacteroidota bacterium]